MTDSAVSSSAATSFLKPPAVSLKTSRFAPGFSSSDYFPLLPYLGWFLLGACLGRLLYSERRSLLPDFPAGAWPIRALRWCGVHSLWIYLLHQPVLYALVQLG